MSRKPDLQTIETEIDECGLEQVLAALAEICLAKAEHVSVNWQDREMARAWTRVAMLLDRTVAHDAVQRAPL